ncbi:Transmembrane protein [Bacillus paranthracis]
MVVVPPTGIESKEIPLSGLNPSCGMVLICTLSGTNESSGGNISIKTGVFAVVFPLLVRVVVYVIVSPTAANALLAVFVAITEAVFTCVKVLLD